jgi:hypothetical protein
MARIRSGFGHRGGANLSKVVHEQYDLRESALKTAIPVGTFSVHRRMP